MALTRPLCAANLVPEKVDWGLPLRKGSLLWGLPNFCGFIRSSLVASVASTWEMTEGLVDMGVLCCLSLHRRFYLGLGSVLA